jgi:predicted HicB family RNase H-like nuclease
MYIKKDRLPESVRKSHLKCKALNIRITESEHARIFKAAAAERISVTKWVERLIFGEDQCK